MRFRQRQADAGLPRTVPILCDDRCRSRRGGNLPREGNCRSAAAKNPKQQFLRFSGIPWSSCTEPGAKPAYCNGGVCASRSASLSGLGCAPAQHHNIRMPNVFD